MMDIDLNELNEIDDPIMRDVLKQMIKRGFAAYDDEEISHKIGRVFPRRKYDRDILIATDRKTHLKTVFINPKLKDYDDVLEISIKKMIEEFR
jgi:hypothetical protein